MTNQRRLSRTALNARAAQRRGVGTFSGQLKFAILSAVGAQIFVCGYVRLCASLRGEEPDEASSAVKKGTCVRLIGPHLRQSSKIVPRWDDAV
jgi:hypothetical protein